MSSCSMRRVECDINIQIMLYVTFDNEMKWVPKHLIFFDYATKDLALLVSIIHDYDVIETTKHSLHYIF